MGTARQVKYAQAGMLLDVYPLVKEHAPNVMKMLESNPVLKKQLVTPDGKMYLIPWVTEDTILTRGEGFAIRQDWLTRLGLKTPETTDELYDVFKQFREKDANGNEKPDEMVTGYPSQLYKIMYGFGTADDWHIADDGKTVVYGPTTESFGYLKYNGKRVNYNSAAKAFEPCIFYAESEQEVINQNNTNLRTEKDTWRDKSIIKYCDFSDCFTDPSWGWDDHGFHGGILSDHMHKCCISNCKATNVWDALNMRYSNDNRIYNNNFSHTSDTGLKLWNSCRNEIYDNDFSYGIRIDPGEVHARDSSGVLIESGSNDNIFKRNNMTYGGDGLFISVLNGWMSTGNYFEENDYTYANNNAIEAIEAWAGGNTYVRNKANYSSYGFWLGGSDNTILS